MSPIGEYQNHGNPWQASSGRRWNPRVRRRAVIAEITVTRCGRKLCCCSSLCVGALWTVGRSARSAAQKQNPVRAGTGTRRRCKLSVDFRKGNSSRYRSSHERADPDLRRLRTPGEAWTSDISCGRTRRRITERGEGHGHCPGAVSSCWRGYRSLAGDLSVKVDRRSCVCALHVLVIGWGLIRSQSNGFEQMPEEILTVEYYFLRDQLAKLPAAARPQEGTSKAAWLRKSPSQAGGRRPLGKSRKAAGLNRHNRASAAAECSRKSPSKKSPIRPSRRREQAKENRSDRRKTDPPKVDPIAEALKKEEKNPPRSHQAQQAAPLAHRAEGRIVVFDHSKIPPSRQSAILPGRP